MAENKKVTREDLVGRNGPFVQGRTKLSPNGRIVIPAAIREKLGFRPNETLVMDVHEGALRVETYLQRIERVQREVARLIPAGVSLADELIADRRAEAKREQEEWDRERNAIENPIRKAS